MTWCRREQTALVGCWVLGCTGVHQVAALIGHKQKGFCRCRLWSMLLLYITTTLATFKMVQCGRTTLWLEGRCMHVAREWGTANSYPASVSRN